MRTFKQPFKSFIRDWSRKDVQRRAVVVATIITPILTLINQYESIVGLDANSFSVKKVLLTFIVPYFVSSISAAAAIRKIRETRN